MNDLAPAKKKRRRRNRRRGSGVQAGAAAVQSLIPAVQVENRPGRHDPYDAATMTAEIRAEQKAHAERIHTADELVSLLIPLITQERHKVVFDWACSGSSPAAFIQRIVRAEIQRLLPSWREAMGGGGKSSQNLETLEKRL